ncbi:zinc finger matrin-type protein 2-like [Condylostylus longicornis]|uniref:zinc finger matrin-type protein 2-like n=1 Tax=Condylostylus longicornis TaxID=2530218 RepID=UPI00244DBE16|nr:zinc finger matrin-type protein 2-like [Condylostylus longicornis]
MAESIEVPKTDALGRKVWDKAFYAKRAAVRQFEDGQDFDHDDFLLDPSQSRKKARKEAPPPAERRPLEQRKDAVSLDTELGKSKIVTTHTPKQQQGGYWCTVCECLIKDSQAYLDHINGKRHNRSLGMTMRVERVGVDRVKQRLNQIKQVQHGEEDQEANDSPAAIAARLRRMFEEQAKASAN